MAQRYNSTTPIEGVNLYDTYTGSTTLGPGQISQAGPTKAQQLGIVPGLRVNGNFNTQWLYCTIGTATTALTAGAAVNIDATTFQANTSTGGISGKPLISVPASASAVGTGFWAEVSGATLNLTPALAGLQQEDEAANDADRWPHEQRQRDAALPSDYVGPHTANMGSPEGVTKAAEEKVKQAEERARRPDDPHRHDEAQHRPLHDPSKPPLPEAAKTTPTAGKPEHKEGKHA